jgi:hypothetical protein
MVVKLGGIVARVSIEDGQFTESNVRLPQMLNRLYGYFCRYLPR